MGKTRLNPQKTPINAEFHIESIGEVRIQKYLILKKLHSKNRYFHSLIQNFEIGADSHATVWTDPSDTTRWECPPGNPSCRHVAILLSSARVSSLHPPQFEIFSAGTGGMRTFLPCKNHTSIFFHKNAMWRQAGYHVVSGKKSFMLIEQKPVEGESAPCSYFLEVY